MKQKTCFKCGTELPIVMFYKHPMMGDGRLGKCKDCTRKDVRENRAKKRDYYNEYDRDRSRNPERIKAIHNSRAPHKRKATVAVNNALRRGKLKRMPCEVCGKVKSEAHHPDYSKPLEVQWLCRQHHVEVHFPR